MWGPGSQHPGGARIPALDAWLTLEGKGLGHVGLTPTGHPFLLLFVRIFFTSGTAAVTCSPLLGTRTAPIRRVQSSCSGVWVRKGLWGGEEGRARQEWAGGCPLSSVTAAFLPPVLRWDQGLGFLALGLGPVLLFDEVV